ncbi:MAG: YebC/PmpR family DNA-binding transcriptional regulator [Clostridia bacterium]|nr:YebC/PmpR family DNA-binding transcriptional regulator [Clostridia bacterium]
MSGHSKWANIKNKKAKGDAARGRIFTKLGREIAVAVKAGGPDPSTNARLYDVIAKCKAANMPNDNIQRGIKKASGELGAVDYEAITYEGYGIGGVAVIVETLTDNKNRTAADVRHCFDKFGGSMGTVGSVSYMFDRKGVIVVERTAKIDEDTLMEYALEAGADDIITTDDAFEVYTSPASFSEVRNYLEEKGLEFLSAEISMIPQNMVTIDGEKLTKFMKMLDLLDESDDVQNVYHNADLPEEEEE